MPIPTITGRFAGTVILLVGAGTVVCWCFRIKSEPGGLGALHVQQNIRHQPRSSSRESVSRALLLPAGEARSAALLSASVEWARHDPAGAADWARNLADRDERKALLMQVAYEASREHPDKALEIAEELPPDPERNQLILHAAMQWASVSPEDSSMWAQQIPNEALRDQITAAIATAWAESDPAAAATMVSDELGEGRVMDNAVIGVIQRWAQTDPLKAGEWVLRFPEGALRQNALSHLVQLWAIKDETAVRVWISDLDTSVDRNTCSASFADRLSPGDSNTRDEVD